MLEIQGIVVQRGLFRVTTPALEVEPGKIAGLCGRSGSGKTTLLNAVAGFVPLTKGRVRVRGQEVHTLPAERRKIAMVFQRSTLFPHLTVEQNIEFGLRVQGVPSKKRRAVAREWLDKVGLDGMHARLPHQISEGQAQRVAIARALVVGFPAVLLDEPFSALDSAARSQLRSLLRALVSETKVSAVFVSHQSEDIRQIADTVWEQHEGEIVWTGPCSEWTPRL